MYLGTDKLCGWKRFIEEATEVNKNFPHNSQPTVPNMDC